MNNCVQCGVSELFQTDIMSAQTYLITGIIIWLLKVLISFCLFHPSTARYQEHQEPHDLIAFVVLGVFFSPNILFWPINILLDIYALSAECLQKYSPTQILHIITGF